jgi:hypothetical protein
MRPENRFKNLKLAAVISNKPTIRAKEKRTFKIVESMKLNKEKFQIA